MVYSRDRETRKSILVVLVKFGAPHVVQEHSFLFFVFFLMIRWSNIQWEGTGSLENENSEG